jgi:hypothetical protein
MSYLLQFARRPDSVTSRKRRARVDERLALNRPGFYGDAAVRVFVGDTSDCRWRNSPPTPRLKLRISDCTNQINLEFDVGSAELRANSLHKIDVLLGALEHFRNGLIAEAELYAEREQH